MLLDGWSMPVLSATSCSTLYAAGADAAGLPAAGPYRDYLAWLAAPDRQAAARRLARGAGRPRSSRPVGAADRAPQPVVPEQLPRRRCRAS